MGTVKRLLPLELRCRTISFRLPSHARGIPYRSIPRRDQQPYHATSCRDFSPNTLSLVPVPITCHGDTVKSNTVPWFLTHVLPSETGNDSHGIIILRDRPPGAPTPTSPIRKPPNFYQVLFFAYSVGHTPHNQASSRSNRRLYIFPRVLVGISGTILK